MSVHIKHFRVHRDKVKFCTSLTLKKDKTLLPSRGPHARGKAVIYKPQLIARRKKHCKYFRTCF